MVSLDEKESRFVLGLIEAAGQAGAVSGNGWEEMCKQLIVLKAKLRGAVYPSAPVTPVPVEKESGT